MFWYLWFRDDPAQDRSISDAELQYILAHRQKLDTSRPTAPLRLATLAGSGDVWLMALQYFCSNFTFLFCRGR